MPSGPTRVKPNYGAYLALPEGRAHELIDGELVPSPYPDRRHQDIVRRLFLALSAFVERKALGRVYAAPTSVLLSDEDVVRPDIAYVSKMRTSVLVPEGLKGPPDLCVEVCSTKTEPTDRGIKRNAYAKRGVREYWLVYPDTTTVEVFRLHDNPKIPVAMLTGGEQLTSELLPGFSQSLAELFAA